MEAHILLADAAQSDQRGKIHALGLGWSTTLTPTPPQAVVILIKVPWNQANQRHTLEAELVTEDGQPVMIPGPLGDQPVKIEGEFEAGRPAGLPHGTPLDMSLAFGIQQGMPLRPGRYVWRLSINGHSEEAWSTGFLVREPSPAVEE
jgi:hypothetical protein